LRDLSVLSARPRLTIYIFPRGRHAKQPRLVGKATLRAYWHKAVAAIGALHIPQ
jgi:hypothetical protein